MSTAKKALDLIFDLDGTLFQTERVAIPAFHRTYRRLENAGLHSGERPSDERVQSVFGMTQEDCWEKLLPGSDRKTKEMADRWWLEEELNCLAEGRGELYPGVEEGLRRFQREGCRLFIASNGLGPYVRGILEHFKLTELFTGVYSAGEQQIGEKENLVAKLMKEHQVDSGVMIGDRSSDVRAGKANGLLVVGCRYSGFPQFGDRDELAGADHVIGSFAELGRVLHR